MWKEQVASRLGQFQSTVDDPRLQPDPYVLASVVERVRVFWDRCEEWGIPDEVAWTVTNHFIDCWRGLDALPRADPFWDDTNRRPTLLKMNGYCAKLLNDHPSEPNILMMTAATQFVAGSYFHVPTWRSLRDVGAWDDSWPVYAALNGLYGGDETAPGLAEFLKEVGPSQPALSALNQWTQAGTPWISDWTEQVLAGLMGPDPKSSPAED